MQIKFHENEVYEKNKEINLGICPPGQEDAGPCQTGSAQQCAPGTTCNTATNTCCGNIVRRRWGK